MATWDVSLKATARRGLIVSYGNAGGPVTGVNLGILAQRGSQFVTRPTLFDYYHLPGERAAGAARSEEHTSELQSLMRISYAVFCLTKKINKSAPSMKHKSPREETITYLTRLVTVYSTTTDPDRHI